MRFKYKAICIAVAAMGCGNAQAAEDQMFSFRGFGTIGAIHSSANNADFVTSINQPNGPGSAMGTSFAPLSRIGVQVDGTFTENLSAVLQVVTERNYDKTFKPKPTQLHLKYRFTPAFDVRLGRMPISLFMLTEFTRIGYAMPYALPPTEIYTANMEVDGIDTTYKFNVGDVALSAHAYYGTLDYKIGAQGLPDPITLQIRKSKGGDLTADYGASTFRFVALTSQFTLKNPTIEGLFDIYRNAGLSALADHYQPKNHKEDFFGAGYSYDPGTWFVRTEAVKISGADDTFAKQTSFYLSGGYRIGEFTPFASYSRQRYDQKTSIGAVDPIGIINGMLAKNDNSRHSISIGSRWDFRDGMALKLQYSHVVRDTATSNNGLINLVPGTAVPNSYNLLMATYDFVF